MATTAVQGTGFRVVLAWLVVGLPLAWGVLATLQKAVLLLHPQ